MKQEQAVRALTVDQWEKLVRSGVEVPVKTRLDGISMAPLIRKQRDVVTIRPLKRPLKRGDIVLFRRTDGAYVVHRVCRMQEDTVVTLGDNCWNEDAPIRRSDVLGIVVSMQRGSRDIRLDSALSRAGGRCWMACHGWRMGYRCIRGAIVRRVKKVIKWKNRG